MQEINKQETREMMAVWPDIVRDVTDVIKDLNLPDVAKWMEKVLDYNVPKGKKIRGLALIYAYKTLVPNDQLTKENLRLARILAWCLELLQACSLLIDDIEDRSMVRRGQPCWYRHTNIGLGAINDGMMLQAAIYYLIHKHFKGKDSYFKLLETFRDQLHMKKFDLLNEQISFKLTLGQSLDMLSTNFGKKPNLDLFTMDRYLRIIENKTAYGLYILPVTMAMDLAGIKDPEMFKQVTPILLEIGRFFQIQDDYVSCFGNSESTGKDDTDIQEGKCTWFIVTALQRATPEQRKILEESYGVSDPEKVKRVRQLFVDMNLSDAYSTFEKETYDLINTHIQQISCGFPHNLLSDLLGLLYRRVS